MNEVFVVEGRRTPFGSLGGVLAEMPAPELAAQVIRELIELSALPAEALDEVIIGQVLQGGSAQAPARQAMRRAGLPDSVHAMTINKVCGSGLKSIMLAADAIRLGESQVVIAGGMESMSLAPYALPAARFGQRLGNGQMIDLVIYDGLLDPYSGQHMGDITEAWTVANGIGREEQDAYAARSYTLAQSAVTNGIFADELVAVVKQTRKGEVTIERDEEPFRGAVDTLSILRPAFGKDGSITAGNASSISDGAALALLAGPEAIKRYGLKPKARLIASATRSIAPHLFAEAPVGAIRACVKKAGLQLADVGLFEINEAFAAVPVLAMRQLELPIEKVNVNGGAVALGHPIGASGGRLAVTLIREMRQRQARYGVAALCIGGGEAVAALFELI
jgi:acetyl-CoA C-acetyltransferase